jgi:hypothetical protein
MRAARIIFATIGSLAVGVSAAATLWVQVGRVGDLGASLPPPPDPPAACGAPQAGTAPPLVAGVGGADDL